MRIRIRHKKMIGMIAESLFIGIGLVGWMKSTWFDLTVVESIYMSLVASGMAYATLLAYKNEES